MRALKRSPLRPETLEWVELPRPVPGSGQVLVHVFAAVAVPAAERVGDGIPGSAFAGEVAAVGGGTLEWRRGDSIHGVAPGTYAEFVLVDGGSVVPPTSSYEAAAASAVFVDAFRALESAGGAQPGATIVILGADTELGLAAVQLARAQGARVTAIADRADAAALLADLGAERVASPAEDLEGPWTGVVDLSRARVEPPLTAAGHREVFRRHIEPLLASGSIRSVIDRVVPFEDVGAAHARVDSGRTLGSVVLRL